MYCPAYPSPAPSKSNSPSHNSDFRAAIDARHPSDNLHLPTYLHHGSTPAPGTTSSTAKAVTLTAGEHSLNGTLHLISTTEYMHYHYPRFFDIPPSDTVSFRDANEPFVIVHSVQGVSWTRGCELPVPPFMTVEVVGVGGEMAKKVTGDFRAVTDDQRVWEGASYLGVCSLSGIYQPLLPVYEDIILALPLQCTLGMHFATLDSRGIHIKDYPPIPVSPSLLQIIHKIQEAVAQKWSLNRNGELSKHYIINDLRSLVDPKTQTLSAQHPLHAHRNNVALFSVQVWKSLCIPKGALKGWRQQKSLPELYYQEVFEDKRGRERWHPGCEKLAEGWYEYDAIQTELELKKWEALLDRPLMEHERQEMWDGERWERFLMQ